MSRSNLFRPEEPWATMNRRFLEDSRLSFRAKGLLAFILSRPNDWVFSVKGCAACATEGKDATTTAIHELEELGYLVRHPVKEGDGKFGGAIWLAAGDPEVLDRFITDGGFTDDGFPADGESGTTNISKEVSKEGTNTPLGRSPRFACDLPDDWVPNEIHIHRAKEFGLDLKLEAEKFRNYYVGHGKKQKDWDRTFHNWLIKAYEYKNPLPSRATTPSQRGGGWLRSLPDE